MNAAVGVIGLGNIGAGLVRNLLRHDFPVVVFDLRPEAVAPLVAAGATAAATVADLGRHTQTVLLAVLNYAQLTAVTLGPGGLVGALPPGSTIIGCSTVAPHEAQALGAALAQHDLHYIDAPVSGGRVGAEAGTLTIMAGADAAVFTAAQPVLEAVSAQIYHTGAIGSGQAAKLCNQIMVGVGLVATAECLTLAAKLGLDRQQIYEIITHGAGDSWAFRSRGARMLAESVPNISRLDIWQKDLAIVLDSAAQHQVTLPVVTAAQQWIQRGLDLGYGAQDDSNLLRVVEAGPDGTPTPRP